MQKTKYILMFVMLLATSVFAEVSPDKIPNRIEGTYVQDFAGVLSSEDEQIIQNRLNELKERYNIEFGVATIKNLEGNDQFEYSIAMARKFGIGSKNGEQRGLLLFLAIENRKWQFQSSSHMEGVLTDIQTSDIGRNFLVPKLKIASKSGASADWRNAILSTVDATEVQVKKNIEPEQITPSQPTDLSVLWWALGGLGVLGTGGLGVAGLMRRRKRILQEKEEAEWQEELYQEKLARERKRKAREAWLKTPKGIAWQKEEDERLREQARERKRQKIVEEKKAEEHRLWLQTPEGIAYTVEENRKAAARRKRAEEESERRSRESSYSSSSSSSSSYSSSSSSSYDSGSSSGGFGGGGDFGGGGSGGSW